MVDAILQGTTPGIQLGIATTDFLVTDIAKLEFAVSNMGVLTRHGLDDVVLDAEHNTITYTFTEAETLALKPIDMLRYQLRCELTDGSIVGTEKMTLRVADLMSEAVMSE